MSRKFLTKSQRDKIFKRRKEIAICLSIYFAIFAVIGIGLYYIAFKPEQEKYVRLTRSTHRMLQKELYGFYLSNDKKIYTSPKEIRDKFCEHLAEKYAVGEHECSIFVLDNEANITLENGVKIYGFEIPPHKSYGTLVKDIIIDVDGVEGKNEVGIDRFPLRIYSTGMLGGNIIPVNCNSLDEENFDMTKSTYCPPGHEVNYLTQPYPISYDAYQVDEHGKIMKYIGKNLSFIRADCMAYGGDLYGSNDYCDHKGFYWIKSCYHDYTCEVAPNTK